jgi:hypothetical protein
VYVPKIKQLYAFVSIGDEPDDEGIIGFQTNDGRFYPLVGADMTRVNQLKPMTGQLYPHKILRFKLGNEFEK